MRIDQLKPGQLAHVASIDEAGATARDALRLRELGFDEGVEVEIEHMGPIGGDPISLRVGSNVVALRRALARLVDVDPAFPANAAE
jgi:ferrous iron transport protein A